MASNAKDSHPLPRHATQEELLILQERLYAQETQFVAQLKEQRERLDKHALRLAAAEARLNLTSHPGSDVSSRDELDGGASGRLHTASYELAAGLLLEDRVRKLEEDLRLLTSKFNDLQAHMMPAMREQGMRQDQHHESLESSTDMMSFMRKLGAWQAQYQESLERLKTLSGSLEKIPEVLDRVAQVEKSQIRSATFLTPHSDPPNTPEADSNLGRLATNDGRRFAKSLEERPEYVLAHSIWDLLLFIGVPELRMYGSMYTFLLAVVNIGLQFFFVMVCNGNFLEPDIQTDVVTAVEFFRAKFGHDLRYVDPHTQQTLAWRVCHDSQYELEIGTAQAYLVENTQKFLRTGPGVGTFRRSFNGETMCILGLVTWTVTVLREFQSICNFAMSVMYLQECPPDEWTKIGVLFKPGAGDNFNTLYFDKVNRGRKFLVFASIVIRLIIAGNLFVVGCIWLATTMDVRELLLNTVALEFVLQIDDILFEALTPGHAKALITNFMPLTRASWWHCHGCELRTGMIFASIPIIVTTFYTVYTTPMVGDMKAALQALCAPPLDFAYGVDVFNVVHISATAVNATLSDLRRRAVEEALVSGGFYTNLTYSINPGRTMSTPLTDIISMKTSELTDVYNPVCQNSEDWTIRKTIDVHLQQMLGATSCVENKGACFDFDTAQGNLIRSICPHTCGCHRLDSDLPVVTANFGCPSACEFSTEWILALEESPCFDPTVSELNQTTYWPQLVKFVTEREARQFGIEGLGSALARHGCNFASHLPPNLALFADIVQERACSGAFVKPISITCPQTCGCTDRHSPSCPIGPMSPWCQCKEHLERMPAEPALSTDVCQQAFCNSDQWPVQATHYLGPNFDSIPSQEVVIQGCRNHSWVMSTVTTTTM